MALEIGTQSGGTVDVGLIEFDEQYTLRWIDHTEPKEEPKYDDPEKLQVRFRCEFEIVDAPDGLVYPKGHEKAGQPLDLTGQRVADFFTVSLHEKSNFGQAVRAMLGMKPDERFVNPRFDVDALCVNHNDDRYGGLLRATVRRKENGYPKLVNFLPVRGAKNMNVPAGAPVAPLAVDPNEPPF
jgi:hypothetical protein